MSELERGETFGEKAVGLGFNPSNDPGVDELKQAYAKIIDLLDRDRKALINKMPRDGDKERLYSIAITEAQGAQMWAVKARTWT